MNQLCDFFYELPEDLIAQAPLTDRASSRLLVLDKKTGAIRHDRFINVLSYLNRGDCLVLNDTKVLPARLRGVKEDTGAAVEVLLIKKTRENFWEALVRPGKRIKTGSKIVFGNGALIAAQEAELKNGARLMRFDYDGEFEAILSALGETPLPPYIKNKITDGERYQTVYAKNAGSVAAPTAGFHFTEKILEDAGHARILTARITLHIGPGTFRPVKCNDITKHEMHAEYYEIAAEQAETINRAKKNGGRIVCVGTTSCRTTETAAFRNDGFDSVNPGSGFTDIFIYPGYDFKITDALITNFHLPESTLLMLVSALAGRENIMSAYKEAVREKYRFYSFGDAMLII